VLACSRELPAAPFLCTRGVCFPKYTVLAWATHLPYGFLLVLCCELIPDNGVRLHPCSPCIR